MLRIIKTWKEFLASGLPRGDERRRVVLPEFFDIGEKRLLDLATKPTPRRSIAISTLARRAENHISNELSNVKPIRTHTRKLTVKERYRVRGGLLLVLLSITTLCANLKTFDKYRARVQVAMEQGLAAIDESVSVLVRERLERGIGLQALDGALDAWAALLPAVHRGCVERVREEDLHGGLNKRVVSREKWNLLVAAGLGAVEYARGKVDFGERAAHGRADAGLRLPVRDFGPKHFHASHILHRKDEALLVARKDLRA